MKVTYCMNTQKTLQTLVVLPTHIPMMLGLSPVLQIRLFPCLFGLKGFNARILFSVLHKTDPIWGFANY